jgi:hypothetical protein
MMVRQHKGQTAPEDVALLMATFSTRNSVCEATILIEQPADVLVLIWRWRQTWRPDFIKLEAW